MVQAELNRPLKFRVWDKIGQKLYNWPIVVSNYIGDNNCTLQQYTGAKDINGKEIFEGDFVKGIPDDEYGAVYWDREYLNFRYISNQFNMPLCNNLKILEVIGNIYEGVSKENKPKELQIGDEVTITGQSSFCSTSKSKIIDIKTKYDENIGVPYKVYVTEGGHKFDGRNGWAINEPTAYYIKEIEEVAHNKFVNNKENQDFVKELLEEIGMA